MAWIRSTTNGNVNFDADKAFATKVQNAMLGALRKHDPATPDRGVKNDDERDSPLGVLNDISLGNSRGGAHLSRACLVEIEFIDVATVDRLLNTGSNVEDVRNDLAAAIARALLDELDVSFDADEHLTPIKRDPAVPKTGQVNRRERLSAAGVGGWQFPQSTLENGHRGERNELLRGARAELVSQVRG